MSSRQRTTCAVRLTGGGVRLAIDLLVVGLEKPLESATPATGEDP